MRTSPCRAIISGTAYPRRRRAARDGGTGTSTASSHPASRTRPATRRPRGRHNPVRPSSLSARMMRAAAPSYRARLRTSRPSASRRRGCGSSATHVAQSARPGASHPAHQTGIRRSSASARCSRQDSGREAIGCTLPCCRGARVAPGTEPPRCGRERRHGRWGGVSAANPVGWRAPGCRPRPSARPGPSARRARPRRRAAARPATDSSLRWRPAPPAP